MEYCGDSARLSGNVIAMKWWRRAADRGTANAQMKLAYLYQEGRAGIPTDYTQAYKWYDIAAAIVGAKIDELPVAASHNGEKDNSNQLWYREQVAKHMTSEQIAEARDWPVNGNLNNRSAPCLKAPTTMVAWRLRTATGASHVAMHKRIRSDDHGRSIRYQNVERYRRLLRTVIDEGRRSFLLGLLAEAQQKQKDAGDSKYQY